MYSEKEQLKRGRTSIKVDNINVKMVFISTDGLSHLGSKGKPLF